MGFESLQNADLAAWSARLLNCRFDFADAARLIIQGCLEKCHSIFHALEGMFQNSHPHIVHGDLHYLRQSDGKSSSV